MQTRPASLLPLKCTLGPSLLPLKCTPGPCWRAGPFGSGLVEDVLLLYTVLDMAAGHHLITDVHGARHMHRNAAGCDSYVCMLFGLVELGCMSHAGLVPGRNCIEKMCIYIYTFLVLLYLVHA